MGKLLATKTWASGETVTIPKLNQWAGGIGINPSDPIDRSNCAATAPLPTTDGAYANIAGQLLLVDDSGITTNYVEKFYEAWPGGGVFADERIYRALQYYGHPGGCGYKAAGAAETAISSSGYDTANQRGRFVAGSGGAIGRPGPHFLAEAGGVGHVEYYEGGLVYWPIAGFPPASLPILAGSLLYVTAVGLLDAMFGVVGTCQPIGIAAENIAAGPGYGAIYVFPCGGYF